MMNETRVFGDGDNLFLFFKEEKREMLYTLRSPICTEVTLEQPNFNDPVNILGGREIELKQARPPLEVKIEFKVMQELPNGDWGYRVESSEDGGLMKGLDLFKKVTVSQLFRAINKKIEKRKSAKH